MSNGKQTDQSKERGAKVMVGRAGLHYSILFLFLISSAWFLRSGEASGRAWAAEQN